MSEQKQRIAFFKMHGAGNDFVLVDDREERFPIEDRTWLARIAARRTGIGCEGIILIQPSATAHFRMRFLNPDGGEVEMCGNGARCVARLAWELGSAPEQMRIETVAGELRAEVLGEQVRLHMTEPCDWQLGRELTVKGRPLTVHSVNTGVPHAVVEVDDLEAVDVAVLGRAVRRHEAFHPAGTNANFFRVDGPDTLRVRTYERGVEAETLACGTGVVATALVAARLGRVQLPAKVLPASGDTLEVGGTAGESGATGVTLTGPAVHVYRGEVEH